MSDTRSVEELAQALDQLEQEIGRLKADYHALNDAAKAQMERSLQCFEALVAARACVEQCRAHLQRPESCECPMIDEHLDGCPVVPLLRACNAVLGEGA
jgi:chromosome segregation ATPase